MRLRDAAKSAEWQSEGACHGHESCAVESRAAPPRRSSALSQTPTSPTADSRNVIVVGMPRSGTSLTMGILARKGYYVGPVKRKRYREGDEHNPFGYFEADALVKRNARIYRRAGFPHHNTWLFDRMSPECAERIRELEPSRDDIELVEAYETKSPWAWKDPRFPYTLGYWWPLMDHERTVVILTQRDPGDVRESFRGMGWPVRDDLLERVEEHFANAQRVAQDMDIPHTVVHYADYLKRPDDVARRIGRLVGLELSVDDLNVRPELDHSKGPRNVRELARRQALKLPRPVRRVIRRATPRWAMELLVPEWKHVAATEEERAQRGIPEPRV